MTENDVKKSLELRQGITETRFLIAQNTDDLKAVRVDVAGFKLNVSNGVPGARLELDAATKREEELATQAQTLSEWLLTMSREAGALEKWDRQARELAQEYRLDEGHMERLFEALKAGKSREEVQRMAGQLKRAEGKPAPVYAFQEPGDVAW